ncbi:glycoside hydrolase family 3 N-terminal domain-containing protein [Cognataquiflexum rubidum]|uniref:glycoside hydrolase family 3 N-terminal domain-containing protein n=1 Tax=Cognataquiflexum rubidum TaxID=2922273 RepID=UPI001F1395A5|nr:glycoside hydrolase family 3 N-terminal domain-containing protein [Cognataquiflexum rubidum]MCH6232638.1 serine hydrolase [Cognataquiflexum rubidum]
MRIKVWGILLGLVVIFQSDVLMGWEKSNLDSKLDEKDPLSTENLGRQMEWVDSVFENNSFEERLGQLFMVAAYSNKDEKHVEEIAKLITEQNIGGLIFFQGGPVRQANLTNYYQSISKMPLFIAMDAEWGVNMRLDSILGFPKAMTLGALPDEDLIYEMGKEIAFQFKSLGMHINFAPVVDVNSNPNNPVIGYRAFGEEKHLVTRKSLAYMKGLQDNGVMANAKHFPGHGDTETDSHYTLPVIKHSETRIKDIDLYPYRELIENDLMSVMVAHLHVPSMDSESNKATTLSKYVVTDLLKKQMNFNGLVFTDALNMKGVSKYMKPGEVDLYALLAGNDVLLYSQNVPKAKALILQAIDEGKISQEEVDEKIRRILKAKFWAGLDQNHSIDTYKLAEKINRPEAALLVEKLYERSITVTSNKDNLLPLRHLDMQNFASLTIGGNGTEFQKKLDKYARFDHFRIENGAVEDSLNGLAEKLQPYQTVIVGMMGITNTPKRNFGVSMSDFDFIKKLSRDKNVILVVFGSAYSIKSLPEMPHNIVAFENNAVTQKMAPEIIFGARNAHGLLPVSANLTLRQGTGGYMEGLGRLSYSIPESQGLDSKRLAKIDTIMAKSIAKQAIPGGVVLVAKNGQVVFEKAYGYYDYKKTRPVSTETVYDLASITKILATTQAVMFLESRGMIDMDKPIGRYIPGLRNTNKEHLILKDILAHEAGLVAFIPHYNKTVEAGQWKPEYYRAAAEQGYTLPVSNEMFAMNSLRDSIWTWTVKSELRKPEANRKKYSYVYSDLTMYLMQALVEELTNQPLDEFLEQNLYNPLGLYSMTFNPVNKYPIDFVAPTEEDVAFRKRQIQGYVHDPGAAMYGGVAGHAGLFGKANDLAVLMQMMLNGGKYADVEFINEETVTEFTKRQSTQSRRGWGWDKPEPEKGKGGSAGNMAPKSTFGHTGFTGTCVWADPENDLIYVFLSNRVHPYAENNLLLKDGVRQEIHDVIYKAMEIQSKRENLVMVKEQ